MPEEKGSPLLRRLGDAIQGLGVLAILGLSGAVLEGRVAIRENTAMIDSQNKLHAQNTANLKANFQLQLKILERVVDGLTNDGSEDLARVRRDLRILWSGQAEIRETLARQEVSDDTVKRRLIALEKRLEKLN